MTMLFVRPMVEVDELTIERRQVREDDVGGQVVRWRKIADVLGRISQPASARPTALTIALQSGQTAPYYVFVMPEIDVQRGDRISDGKRQLYVDAVQWPSTEPYHRAECREYQDEVPDYAPPEPEH